MLDVGDKALDFTLPTDSQTGDGTLSSASLAGQPYVLYFYPKDNTSGCTTEACAFRDNWARITGAGATVVGVSKDSVKSHDRFKAKHELPFPLVSDTELLLLKAYGAWGPKKLYGREYEGVIRSTFIIDASGTITHAWRKVRVKGHVDQVLAALGLD